MSWKCTFPVCDCVRQCHLVTKQLSTMRLLPVSKKMAQDWNNKPCPYCGDAMHASDPGHEPTWDHVCPSSRGGSNEAFNKIAACRTCNFDKGNQLLSEWVVNLMRVNDWRAGYVALFIQSQNPRTEQAA